MRRIAISALMLLGSTLSFAAPASNLDPKMEEHVQMHEKIGAAHIKVAECLRSGKPKDECGPAFHQECESIPQSKGFCGGRHKHGKGKHQPK